MNKLETLYASIKGLEKLGLTIKREESEVWFVEKNKETASSEYARGDSFGLHKNLSLYNSYRIGRLGAKPELGSIFINLEEL